jgi:hypothetical protein
MSWKTHQARVETDIDEVKKSNTKLGIENLSENLKLQSLPDVMNKTPNL